MKKIALILATMLLSSPAMSADILVSIDKSEQKMSVFVDGSEQYTWPVSTGKSGYDTPGGTYTASSMNEIWYSKQWDNAPMPHAIFYMKDGHAIHGTTEEKNLGKPASHGCVRLARANATVLYDLVKENGLENTQVVISGEAPHYASPAPERRQVQKKPQRRRLAPPVRRFDPYNLYHGFRGGY